MGTAHAYEYGLSHSTSEKMHLNTASIQPVEVGLGIEKLLMQRS